jgi:hypothetical protein
MQRGKRLKWLFQSLVIVALRCYKAGSRRSPRCIWESAMEHNETPPSSSRDTYLAIMLLVLVGLPCFVFFNVLTAGLFVLLLFLAAGIAVLGAFNYLLWGHFFSEETAEERQAEESRARIETED